MRTHAHGQGFADLNFMIPELISTMHYSKGPFRLLADDAAQRPQTLFGKS